LAAAGFREIVNDSQGSALTRGKDGEGTEGGFWRAAQARSVYLFCSGSFGSPRGTRTGERGREVGILLGIETEGTSIGSEVTGKSLAMNPHLDGGSARIR
jgi:hypothetical protein